jgi:hypothetical protein
MNPVTVMALQFVALVLGLGATVLILWEDRRR